MEAREKKAAFLEYMLSCLKLPGRHRGPTHLTVTEAREWGPRFEAVVSRAAFKLRRSWNWRPPCWWPEVLALALKGPHLAEGELAAATTACQLLGLTSPRTEIYRLPLSGEPRPGGAGLSAPLRANPAVN